MATGRASRRGETSGCAGGRRPPTGKTPTAAVAAAACGGVAFADQSEQKVCALARRGQPFLILRPM